MQINNTIIKPSLKIKYKLIATFIFLVLVPITIIGSVSYINGRNELKLKEFETLTAITTSRKNTLEILLELRMQQVKMFGAKYNLKKILNLDLEKKGNKDGDEAMLNQLRDDFIKSELDEYINLTTYYRFVVVGQSGRVVLSNDSSLTNKNYVRNKLFIKGMQQSFHGDIFIDPKTNKAAINTVTNIFSSEDKEMPIGVVIATMGTGVINSIFSNYEGMASTGEVILERRYDDRMKIISSLRHLDESQEYILQNNFSFLEREVLTKTINNGILKDYRNKEIEYVAENVPNTNWVIVGKQDISEAYNSIYVLRNNILIIAFIVLIISFFLAVFFSRIFSLPISRLAIAFKKMEKGEIPDKIEVNSNDEFGLLANSFNLIIETRKELARTVDSIGKGNYDIDIVLRSDKDVLGEGLINMKLDLIEFNKLNKEKLWLQKGESESTKIIVGDNDFLTIAENTINQIVPYIGAQTATLYVFDEEKNSLIHTASTKYSSIKRSVSDINIGDGFIGKAAADKKIIFLESLPDDYLIAGLNKSDKPKNAIIIPFIANNLLMGVIEIISKNEITSLTQDLLNRISGSIAVAIESSKSRQKINDLLIHTQSINKDLFVSEEELRKQNVKMEIIKIELEQQIECLNHAAIISETTSDGTITSVNSRLCEISQFSREELIGSDHRMLNSNMQPKSLFTGLWESVLVGNVWQGVIINKKKNGDIYWVDTTIMPFKDVNGKILKFVAISFDITKQMEQQDKLKEQTYYLEQTQIKLKLSLKKEKELSELKSRFVSTASHQFRTPLTVIQASVGVLEYQKDQMSESLVPRFEKMHQRVLEQINRMTSLMDDVLIMGKLNEGNFLAELRPTNIVELCDKIITNYNDIQEDKRTTKLDVVGNPVLLLLDKKLVEHAFSNILSNAFKYSVGEIPPIVCIYFENQKVKINIKDFGMGIPEEDIKHLFKPFFRASNTIDISGTGLGSTVAKDYIELNKGVLVVNSQLGLGSEFCIEFNLSSIIQTTD
jgi:PAS domain S-box-containing protein